MKSWDCSKSIPQNSCNKVHVSICYLSICYLSDTLSLNKVPPNFNFICCNEPIWLAHHSKKTETKEAPQNKTKQNKATHLVMALPNVIWPWSIFYSKDQLLRKENRESLGVFLLFKIKYSKLN
jgi:hypothetical protein